MLVKRQHFFFFLGARFSWLHKLEKLPGVERVLWLVLQLAVDSFNFNLCCTVPI